MKRSKGMRSPQDLVKQANPIKKPKRQDQRDHASQFEMKVPQSILNRRMHVGKLSMVAHVDTCLQLMLRLLQLMIDVTELHC